MTIQRGPDVAVALIESKQQRDHFLIQYRALDNKQYPGWIEFPGGKNEQGEELEDTLLREVAEEVGITVWKPKHLVTTDYKFPSGLSHRVHFYVVTDYIGEAIGKEGQRVGWLSLYQLITYPKCLPLNRAAALILTTERHPDILE
jgi:mutator protein MutT